MFLVRYIRIHQEWQYASSGMRMSLTGNAHPPWEGERDSLVMQIFLKSTRIKLSLHKVLF